MHKVEWLNKEKLVMFSMNTICCVDIELLLTMNHTEVNALLLCKRLDMLKCHNGGHGRRRNLGLRSSSDGLFWDKTTPHVCKELFVQSLFHVRLSCIIGKSISVPSNNKIRACQKHSSKNHWQDTTKYPLVRLVYIVCYSLKWSLCTIMMTYHYDKHSMMSQHVVYFIIRHGSRWDIFSIQKQTLQSVHSF